VHLERLRVPIQIRKAVREAILTARHENRLVQHLCPP
jgi:hypothetical protein